MTNISAQAKIQRAYPPLTEPMAKIAALGEALEPEDHREALKAVRMMELEKGRGEEREAERGRE